MKKLMIVVVLALISMAGAAQNFKANLDESVKPGDDFWQYAVGSWLKNTPLDKEHPMNGAFVDLDELKSRMRSLTASLRAAEDYPQARAAFAVSR